MFIRSPIVAGEFMILIKMLVSSFFQNERKKNLLETKAESHHRQKAFPFFVMVFAFTFDGDLLEKSIYSKTRTFLHASSGGKKSAS